MSHTKGGTVHGDDLGDLLVYGAVMTDQAYRSAARVGGVIPQAINCPFCGLYAPFKDDQMAARYECPRGHATAAMLADGAVCGRRAHKPFEAVEGE